MEEAHASYHEILEWEMVERGVRHFIILRQMELYDRPFSKMTRYEWSCAKQRASRFMPLLGSWLTVLREYDDALQNMSGSLNRAMRSGDLSESECQLLSECRIIIEGIRSDLDFACRVLANHESISPTHTENYDPDFVADMERLEILLDECENQIAEGLGLR